MYLNEIKDSKSYMIEKINLNNKDLQRLYDIGLIEGSKINLELVSPSKTIKAYNIKGTIIAIRDSNAKNIIVGDVND